jgi:putative membrane protein
MLTAEDRLRVEAAIREAERGTAGEIVLVIARQAASYRSVPLLYALAAALLTPLPLLLWGGLPPVRTFLVQLAAAALALAVASRPALRHRLLPRAVRHARAREAAEREFAARGLAETRGRTGVLVFVALAERHAEVIGDVAIADKIEDAEWRAIVDDLVDGFGRGAPAEGLVLAIGRIGALLARHVPPGTGDTDELPNRVVML